ncbi:hypothetical protein, conserved [Trypanosoma brucei brucei TREU927]|uniref:Thioredoxin-like fold domain-containing protein n=1 Tax=Trypanosoma brucei brucei (strain 927/4 GUTat10.1) TaxID=185431 RepID=Q4GYY9_TRYB2|nr:hypothetical protein, conserved [Trypanosoma brucei brucei TREU927]CAJ16353.1 hypothetical protein, conserved [Trypanosoma brucei brucei TREU927]
MRCCSTALRTGRRGPGGWTEPRLQQATSTDFMRDSTGTGGDNNNNNNNDGGKGPSSALKRHFNVNDFSMIERQQMTLTKLMRITMDATFKPKDPDSRTYGGDGATQRAALREELKTMDSRIVPFAHEEILNDYLKNIVELSGPSGQRYDREMLRGRLVGLLFFTETDRSLAFMRLLREFHQRHRRDFVVVAISLGGKEMMDITRQHGFYHCSHRDGATWVQRDTGLMVRPWTPLPRLIVVNGTSGEEITSSGVTAVKAHPNTCFEKWKNGEEGCDWWDYIKTFYM